MRTSCEPAPYYSVGLISGPPVARFAHLVRDAGGMSGFPIPLPITEKYATFNESYAKAVRNRCFWVCSESGLPDDLSWGRLGYIRWLDTAQDLCHSKITHPLDHTDFTPRKVP